MRYELFEEVLQYKLARGGSQLGDRDDDDDDDDHSQFFFRIAYHAAIIVIMLTVSCIQRANTRLTSFKM